MSEFNQSEDTNEPWELYYWANMKEDGKNHMIGRGEFVRLMFEVLNLILPLLIRIPLSKDLFSLVLNQIAGVKYIDHGVSDTSKVFQFIYKGGNTGFPIFAPPAIKKGSFVMSQTPAIMKYLGKEFNLFPKSKEDEAYADQMIAFVTDFVAEGRLVFHPKCFTMSYYQQIEEAKPTVAWFETERLPKFLTFLETVSSYTNSGYFVGDALTYVDVGVFHALEAAASQFPETYTRITADKPRLESFRAMMRSLPRIAEYLASDRRGLFEGNSMM